jgi:Sec-independent protein translocase protein TatA
MLMKLLSPGGLIVIAIIVAIIFLPRRLPDAAKKMRKPMRAFPDEPAERADADGKQPGNTPEP